MGQEGTTVENHSVETVPSSDVVESLLEAARYDDIDDIMSLVAGGVSLDSKDSQGRTGSLMSRHSRAVGFESRYFSVEYNLGVQKPNNHLALHMASANGHLDIVEYLISRGVDLNATNEEMNTPLHWACLNGHVEVVKKLILAGANVSVLNSHEKSPLDEAVSGQKMDVIDAINESVAQVELVGIKVSS